jgi:uracil-DNA glycosylase
VRDDEFPTAVAFFPARRTLPAMRRAAASCEGCPLHRCGTQTVFGEGKVGAPVMFVGEQPGDAEDRTGKPFVGPAGRMLDKALLEVGLSRDDAYVTNAVKHFKWQAKGKRRLHQKPNSREVGACLPWLEQELELVKPRVLVCLGATAAQILLGKQFRVTKQRGQLIESDWAPFVMATVHPSSILRAPSDEDRRRAFAAFVDDLRKVAEVVRSEGPTYKASARGRRRTEATRSSNAGS